VNKKKEKNININIKYIHHALTLIHIFKMGDPPLLAKSTKYIYYNYKSPNIYIYICYPNVHEATHIYMPPQYTQATHMK
jgi:hypothetical protein